MPSIAWVLCLALAWPATSQPPSPLPDVHTIAARLAEPWRWRTVAVPDDAHVSRVVALEHDVLFVATRRRSYLFDGASWTETQAAMPDDATAEHDDVAFRIAEDGTLTIRGAARDVALRGPWANERAADVAVLPNGQLAIAMLSGRLLLCDLVSERWTRHGVAHALGTNTIDALTRARDGGLWIGTSLGVAHLRDGRVTRELTVPDALADAGLRVRIVTAVHEDERGRVWVGSGSGFPGAVEFAPDGARWHRAANSPVTHCVHAIDESSDGALWFCMLAKGPGIQVPSGGLARLHDGEWTHWTTADGLPSDRVYATAEAPDGTIVAGTVAGVAYLDGDRWVPLDDGMDGIVQVRDLAFDGDVLWGVFRRHEGIAFRAHWSRGGLSDVERWEGPMAEAILPDGRDGAWVTTAFGLRHVSPRGIASLSHPDAAPDPMWPIVDGGDHLWIGTKHGLQRFRPDDVTPPVLRDVTTTWADRRDRLFVSVDAIDAWHVTPADRLLASWRLDDRPWSPGRPLADGFEIDGLSPGMERVSVRVIDAYGNVSAPSTVWVDVEAPWYLAWPTLAGLALTGLGVGAWWRERRRRRHERARAHRELLEAQERERGIIAHEIHDGLGSLLQLAETDIDQADGLTDDARRDQLLHHALVACRTAAERVHDLSTRLRPRVLDELGLCDALQTELDVFAKRLDVRVDRELDARVDELPIATASQVFRIVLEALATIERGARRVEHVEVTARLEGERLVVQVDDDADRGPHRRSHDEHHVSHERAESLGGSLLVTERRDRPGRRLVLELPVARERSVS